MLGKNNLSHIDIVVLSTPRCPPKPPLCISLTIFIHKELFGMKKNWFLTKKPSWIWKFKYDALSMLQGVVHAS